jgi:hypothetical protein
MIRKRYFLAILGFLALNHVLDWGPFNLLVMVYAQATTVTGQVKDVNGVPYASARLTANLANADGTTFTSPATTTQASNAICQAAGRGPAPCQMPFATNVGPVTLDAGGNIAGGGIALTDVTLISPAGKLWLITVNTPGNTPPLGTGPQTCSALLSISGGSQNISASFSTCPALSTIIPAAGSGITSLNGLNAASQTFVNDTNVTVTSVGTQHTFGWSGTLAKARALATAVYTDQPNSYSSGPQNLGAQNLTSSVANEGVTGTTLNMLAKPTAANPTTVIITSAGDTNAFGIVVAGAGTTGSAQLTISGQASCVFDGATTAGDFVQVSQTVNGNCHDAGAVRPTAGKIVGRVLTTNGGAGTYNVFLFGEGTQGSVNTNATAVYGAFLQDFSTATMELPESPGCTTNVDSTVCIDLTNNNLHIWLGADSIIPFASSTGSWVNGDCAKIFVSAGKFGIADNGAICGSGTFTPQTNGVTNATTTGLNFITSTVNTDGLTITPSNPATTQEKMEITGTALPVGGGTGVSNPAAHAIPVAEGSSNFNFACSSSLTGQQLQTNNAADPTCVSSGVPGTDVNAASYTVRCDSATATLDRATTVRFITTAPTVTVPDPTASGCGSNFPVTLIASGVTATVNRTTTAVFNIYNGSTTSTAQTTFTLTTGQYATLTSPDNANWLVRIVSGGGGAVSSVSNSDGTLTISPTTGAVVASIALGHPNSWTGQQSFVAPILGTPASGTLTNTTGYLWNNLAPPTANLALAMSTFTSIFTTTTAEAQMFALKNTTAAVVGTSQGSPVPAFCGTAFHASATVEDCITLSDLPGNGNDAAIQFTIGHSGPSTGPVDTAFPATVSAGSINLPGTAGFVDIAQGTSNATAAKCATANSKCYMGPTALTANIETLAPATAQGMFGVTGTAATTNEMYSGDANHSTIVTIGSGTSIGSTPICSTANCPVGTYRVNVYLDITTACGTSGTYIVNLIYTDDQGSKTIPVNINGTGAVPATGTLTTTSTANYGENAQVIRSTGVASINYSTTATACGTAGPMVGKLYLSVEPVQ